MEFMARCSRCGALVDASSKEFGDWKIVYYTPCAAVTKVGRNVSDYTALCPDCMEQLKEWLAQAPEDKKGQVDESADGDSVERLAADMAKVVVRTMADESDGADSAACHYFGHNGVPCVDDSGTCPACCLIIGKTCAEFALEDIHRRCKALGIDLEEDSDAKR